MKKRIIPIIVAGTIVGATATAPLVHAGNADDSKKPSMEQRGEQAQGAIKDAWLDGRLETALLFNEHLNSFNIDTDVKQGVAYLRGAVESDIDRDLAGEIAESIDGVREIRNELVVDKMKASERDDDEESKNRKGFQQAVSNATLTARIKSELLVNSNTAGLSINVDSTSSAVTLSGEVDSKQEKDLAGKIAQNAAGERSINNRLTVASGS